MAIYLWLPSRNKDLDPKVIERFQDTAKSLGFDTDKLIIVDQK